MEKPTRAELEKLLWDVHAADCFERDALDILAQAEGTKIDKLQELIEVVGSETGMLELDGDDREDLRNMRTTALRGAILLLYAAWFADHRERRARKPDDKQTAIPGVSARGSRRGRLMMKAAVLSAVRAAEPDGTAFDALAKRLASLAGPDGVSLRALAKAVEALEEEGRVRWNKWDGWKLRLTACQRELDVEAGI
jgi:hypothetical protein